MILEMDQCSLPEQNCTKTVTHKRKIDQKINNYHHSTEFLPESVQFRSAAMPQLGKKIKDILTVVESGHTSKPFVDPLRPIQASSISNAVLILYKDLIGILHDSF